MPHFICASAQLVRVSRLGFVLLALLFPGVHASPLPKGTLLTIKQGQIGYPEGACSGSYVRYLNDAIACYPLGPGTDGGLVVGKDQKSGGQEQGVNGFRRQAGQLTSAFSRMGYASLATEPMQGAKGGKATTAAALNRFDDASCSAAACIGKVEINTLHQAYNGYVIPGGCALDDCTATGGSGVKSWVVKADRSYFLDALFGGIQVHLEGAIILPGNTAPEAQAVNVTTLAGAPVQWKPLVSDADADKLSCELLPGNSGFVGSMSLAPDCSVGVYYPPNTLFTGQQCRQYQASDGKNASTPAQVCVNILPKPPTPKKIRI